MIKRETNELGTEIRPGEGVVKEERFPKKHQETLLLADLWGVLKSQRAT